MACSYWPAPIGSYLPAPIAPIDLLLLAHIGLLLWYPIGLLLLLLLACSNWLKKIVAGNEDDFDNEIKKIGSGKKSTLHQPLQLKLEGKIFLTGQFLS